MLPLLKLSAVCVASGLGIVRSWVELRRVSLVRFVDVWVGFVNEFLQLSVEHAERLIAVQSEQKIEPRVTMTLALSSLDHSSASY